MKDFKDPMSQFHSKRTAKVVKPEQATRKHEEADLHLAFCKWVKFQYPKLYFIRHERERARGYMLQGLFKMYNSMEGLPDFELLEPSGVRSRLYIEFKKPGEKWLTKDEITVKEQYRHQYECHLKLWDKGSCAYFCNDFEQAQGLLINYLKGSWVRQQVYK